MSTPDSEGESRSRFNVGGEGEGSSVVAASVSDIQAAMVSYEVDVAVELDSSSGS